MTTPDAEELSGCTAVQGATPSDPDAARDPGDEARRREVRAKAIRKGLVIVNTGTGKGKTTAALGVVTRAWGRGLRIKVIQFLKHEGARFGEVRAAQRMGIDWSASGDGWTWLSHDLDVSAERARRGWLQAKEAIQQDTLDLLVLDEFTYPLHFGWLDTREVVDWLREHKPPLLHLIITGRHAPEVLVEYADLVTEMRNVKHPYEEQGIRAQPGIDY